MCLAGAMVASSRPGLPQEGSSMSYENTLDRWNRERRERQAESDHQYEVSRLEQEVRNQEYRTREAHRQAESYREGARASAQAEYEEYRDDIGALEDQVAELDEQIKISRLWSARWKALAKKQRAGRTAAGKGEA